MKTSRRSFIRQAGLAGALAGFPTIIPAHVLGKNGQIPPSEKVNIGIIGCGQRSGYADQYQLYPKSQIVAVCDPIEERRLAKKSKLGNGYLIFTRSSGFQV